MWQCQPAPTPISGIINGMVLGVIVSSNPSTWVLIATTCTSIDSMGKDKVQEIIANYAPPLIGSNSSMVVTTSSLWILVATIVAYTGENFWKQ